MPRITFFRQARVDGGIRTGINVDGDTVEHFESGPDELDPVLAWFVDLRCDGDDLPLNAEEARQWFLEHRTIITDGFLGLSKKLTLGMDPDIQPVQWEISDSPSGVRMKTVCCSARTAPARKMGMIAQEMAEHWEEYLGQLYAAEVP
ncbi:MAG TPA: hypothetical protein VMY42_10330 [Thermoguttaceae bacterium]|nr:hypothetical protein [Thermoguttaceae bacterium]